MHNSVPSGLMLSHKLFEKSVFYMGLPFLFREGGLG